jgi:hypothetical protein
MEDMDVLISPAKQALLVIAMITWGLSWASAKNPL